MINCIKNKFPNLPITLCKVMIGTILVVTIPFGGPRIVRASTSYSRSYRTYTVKSGDTLWKLSNTFEVSIDDIKSMNALTNDSIYVDQVLKIPTNDTTFMYIVKSGDTLWKIASNNNTTIDEIKVLNNLTSDMIYPGQELILQIKSESIDAPDEVTEFTEDTYTVQPGDTLWIISNRFNMTISHLKSINNLTSDTIYVGQVLNLVEPNVVSEPTISYVTHTVKSGENPWTISLDYGIPMQELLNENGLTSSSSLSIGQELNIPVHNIPIKTTPGEQYGEYLDWWSEAQYVFPINATAKVIDFETKREFTVKRTIGANHADSEPLTANDTSIAKEIWGGYSWSSRPILIVIDGRQIAASMSFMPHDIQYINDNNFDGHFDIHFLNSTRHVDGSIDLSHQENIKISAGVR